MVDKTENLFFTSKLDFFSYSLTYFQTYIGCGVLIKPFLRFSISSSMEHLILFLFFEGGGCSGLNIPGDASDLLEVDGDDKNGVWLGCSSTSLSHSSMKSGGLVIPWKLTENPLVQS